MSKVTHVADRKRASTVVSVVYLGLDILFQAASRQTQANCLKYGERCIVSDLVSESWKLQHR